MDDEPWHLDKRIPIALIVTILLQTAAAVWWAADVSGTIRNLDAADKRHEVLMEQLRTDAVGREARLRLVEQGGQRMEAQLDNIIAGVDRLNDRLERLLEGQSP
jgi:hypothetical protein